MSICSRISSDRFTILKIYFYYTLHKAYICLRDSSLFKWLRQSALSILPAKPVSPALLVLLLKERTSPTGDFGYINKRCRVYRRSCLQCDVNRKRPFFLKTAETDHPKMSGNIPKGPPTKDVGLKLLNGFLMELNVQFHGKFKVQKIKFNLHII